MVYVTVGHLLCSGGLAEVLMELCNPKATDSKNQHTHREGNFDFTPFVEKRLSSKSGPDIGEVF